MELLLVFFFVALLLLGVCVSFVPGLPVMLYMLVVAGLFGLASGFTLLTPNELLLLAGIYAVSFLTDLSSGVLGAKYGGASLKSLLLGFLGAVVGMLLFPPLGGILGLFLGVLLGELRRQKDYQRAFRAASFGVAGAFVGVLINIFLALMFFGTFIAFVFFLN